MAHTTRDIRLAAVAAKQHGAFTWRQAITVGFTARAASRRVRAGVWTEVAHHVFVVAASAPTWRRALMCAVLEVGPKAVASHRSAAALLGIPGFQPGAVELTTKRGGNHRPSLSRLHETSWLPPQHRTTIEGVPCTTIARCIFDLAGTEHPKRVARALDNALSQLGLSFSKVAEVVAVLGRRGRPGTALMRDLLEERGPGYVPPASDLEDLFVAVCEAFGLPPAERQLWAGGEAPVGRVDFAYPKAKLLIECQSRRHHTSLLDVEADIDRRAELVAAGWSIMEVTWHQLVHEPEKVAARIRRALRTASGRCEPRTSANVR